MQGLREVALDAQRDRAQQEAGESENEGILLSGVSGGVLECETDDLIAKIEEFKNEGCTLFG